MTAPLMPRTAKLIHLANAETALVLERHFQRIATRSTRPDEFCSTIQDFEDKNTKTRNCDWLRIRTKVLIMACDVSQNA